MIELTTEELEDLRGMAEAAHREFCYDPTCEGPCKPLIDKLGRMIEERKDAKCTG